MHEHKKREGGFRSAESILKVKEKREREQREDLTGYEFSREPRDRAKEIARLENSYGSIAFGNAPKSGMTILVSEKRRHDAPSITSREKKLQESRQVSRPVGGGGVYTNNGTRQEGAAAFQYGRGLSPRLMIRKMKDYTDRYEQRTLRQMTPFLITDRDRERRRELGHAARELREQKQFTQAQRLEREKEGFDAELRTKEQLERKLYQKLVSAVETMEREDRFTFHEDFRRLPQVILAAVSQRPESPEAQEIQEPEETESPPEADERKDQNKKNRE